MDAFFPHPTFLGRTESTVRHRFVRADPATVQIDPATASQSAAVGPWSEPLDDTLIDTRDHPVEIEKLPLKIRFGVILGGALLGWAVPIAIATRLL